MKDRIQEQKIAREKSNDFLDVLLEYEEQGREGPRKISYHNVNIFALVKHLRILQDDTVRIW